MTFKCTQVYNSESYEYFQMGICRCLCHSSFNFVNMRFVAKVTFFPTSIRRSTFMESLSQNFVISLFTPTYAVLDD